MITINLLPEELRVVEQTSPVRYMSIVVALVLIVIPILVFIGMHVYLDDKASKLKSVTDERDALKKFEEKHNKLNELLNNFKTRDEAVEMVKAKRVLFSKKLFEFAEILYNNRHPIWLTNLSIVPSAGGPGRKPLTPGILAQYEWKFNCVLISPTVTKGTAFYNDLRKDENFAKDFSYFEVPRFEMSESGAQDKKIAWTFSTKLIMDIQSPKGTPK